MWMQFIKNILFKKKDIGYNKKIKYLLSIDIDFYGGPLSYLTLDVLEPTILDSLNIMKKVNNSNLKEDRVIIRLINQDYFIKTKFIDWYTDNGYVIDSSYFKSWLRELEKFIKIYEQNKNSLEGKVYGNIRQIQFHYKELLNLVDIFYYTLK